MQVFFGLRRLKFFLHMRSCFAPSVICLWLTLILGTAIPVMLFAQEVNIGTPPIWNYSRKTYKAGTQNWDATQDNNKIIYWANNDGLLSFDGTQWLTYPVDNHTIVRSIAFDGKDRIYAGAQSEMGYFSPDDRGRLVFTSLVRLLPEEHRNFEDVWDIVFYDHDVFFRTNKAVFEYTGREIRIYPVDGSLESMFATTAGLWLQQDMQRLLKYTGSSFEPWLSVSALQSPITGVIPWADDTLLITTLKHGLFFYGDEQIKPWPNPFNDMLIEKRIYSSTLLKNGNIALGTSLDGLIVINKKRQVFRHLNKKDGLQNNNILHTFCDRAGNLWMGLDNGIDCAVMDSKFTTLFPDNELQATAYAAALFKDNLYLGVSNGAYVAPWQSYYDPESQPYFRRVTNGEGQVWGFNVIGDNLLMGHHEGPFEVEGTNARRISPDQGTWTYVQLSDSYMLAGTYTGLVLYQKKNGKWIYDGKIKGIHESCRIMVRDEDGSVWVSHPYRGLYRINWSEEKKYEPAIAFFDQQSGLPSNLNNYVFLIAGKAVFGTEKGVYNYNAASGKFLPDTQFNQLIGENHRVKCMQEDVKGNILYVTDIETGILLVEEYGLKKEVRKKVFPELHGKLVGGFEMIYPIDADNILFGAEEGFILYHDQPLPEVDSTLQLVFNGIRIVRSEDSLLFGGTTLTNESFSHQTLYELSPDLNNMSFSFSVTEFKTPHLIQYRTRMDGFEDEWSQWTSDTRRDFTNLGASQYAFYAQARIKDGIESNIISYPFSIRPPWFKSNTAMVMYGAGVLSMFAGLIMRQRKKFESEKTQMTRKHLEKEAQHLREVEQSKAALSEIQNEKLEVEIKYKNQELATTTLHLVQKAEILLTVQEALNQIQEKNKDPLVKKDVQHLLNLLNFDVKLDEDWEHFAHHFDQVHVDFLTRLREQFPQLSSSDYKLCAFLRMNLSTKEIAPLLNISVRGVEGSRYRLRKKLNLPNDANLTEFILGLPASKNGYHHKSTDNQ